MSKGPSGSTTTTNTSTPWSGLQPYLTNLYGGAQGLAQTDPNTAYPGQTVAPLNAQQLQSMDLTQQRALAGSPDTNAAQQQNFDTSSGQYLSAGNPYFGNMVNQIAQQVNPQVASGFEQGGRLGSGAQANAFESALTNQAGNLAFQNYTNERNNQMTAAGQAPALANQDYTDINALGNVGNQLQQQQQSYITEDQNRYQQNQQGPWTTLQQEGGLLGQIQVPGNSTTSQPYFKKSDLRLKTDLLKIGEKRGIPLYWFRYRGRPGKMYEGVMAQDVLKVCPDAVVMASDGYYAVNYAMLGLELKEIRPC